MNYCGNNVDRKLIRICFKKYCLEATLLLFSINFSRVQKVNRYSKECIFYTAMHYLRVFSDNMNINVRKVQCVGTSLAHVQRV